MAGFRLRRFALRVIERDLSEYDLIVGVARRIDPLVDVRGHGRRQRSAGREPVDMLDRMPDDLLQRRQLYGEIVLRGDFLRDRLIVFGLRFVRVGDRRVAHFE
ncbi:hypothetical protein LMG28727_03705 [Paraburkholderia kirstenboschensis]|uniref:hypothetical protein n=1 Tax=Paraburkholderia kirstenboschensis TaxID=1245436 RepID=UPI00191B5712|nr:hypothetical protein [Paraburkholderia kirstenboschensis]CAD6539961.1 hypothetical protein LMG28727_03705 [Paraburkholderia kirstenboschensis]